MRSIEWRYFHWHELPQTTQLYPRGASDARVIAIIVYRVSVCLSVWVCVSHAGIVSKQLNLGSRKQYHVIAQGL